MLSHFWESKEEISLALGALKRIKSWHFKRVLTRNQIYLGKPFKTFRLHFNKGRYIGKTDLVKVTKNIPCRIFERLISTKVRKIFNCLSTFFNVKKYLDQTIDPTFCHEFSTKTLAKSIKLS